MNSTRRPGTSFATRAYVGDDFLDRPPLGSAA
jgi:hypothetical protein